MKLVSEEILKVKKIDIINEESNSLEKIEKQEVLTESMIGDMVKKTIDDTMEYIINKVTNELLKNDDLINKFTDSFLKNINIKLEKKD